MIELRPGLFCGSDIDTVDWPYAVLHCAKEPWHRSMVGYSERGAPKDSPEYFVARRGLNVALNLIDGPDPSFIDSNMILMGLLFISEMVSYTTPVLVHCNEGKSRAPSICLLWLRKHDDRFGRLTFDQGERRFHMLYPNYAPRDGIRGFVRDRWNG